MIIDFFNQQVVVQRATSSGNSFGGKSKTWTTHLTLYALIDNTSGTQNKIAEQYTKDTTDIMFCDAGRDITIFDRILYNNETYRILHVDSPFGRHMEILLQRLGVDSNA